MPARFTDLWKDDNNLDYQPFRAEDKIWASHVSQLPALPTAIHRVRHV